MKSKPLLLKIPISLLVITLVSNLAGFISSTLFQSLYVVSFNHLEGEPLSTQITYSMGAGMFIAFIAIPFSIVLVAAIALFSTEFTKLHFIAAGAIGMLCGVSLWGSVYWGIPILAYCFTTAISVVLLVSWRQKHLTSSSKTTPKSGAF